MDDLRFYVVVVNVADATRRARVRQILRSLGEPIHRDSYELAIAPHALRGLQTALTLELKADDAVRIYPVCERCQQKVAIYGGGDLAAPPTAYVF